MVQTSRPEALSFPAGWIRAEKLVTIITGALLTINISVTSWLCLRVIEQGNHVAEIRGNRFTSTDGLAIWKEIAVLRELMAKIPSESPPRWYVEAQEKMWNSMSRRIDSIETKIDKATDVLLETRQTVIMHIGNIAKEPEARP